MQSITQPAVDEPTQTMPSDAKHKYMCRSMEGICTGRNSPAFNGEESVLELLHGPRGNGKGGKHREKHVRGDPGEALKMPTGRGMTPKEVARPPNMSPALLLCLVLDLGREWLATVLMLMSGHPFYRRVIGERICTCSLPLLGSWATLPPLRRRASSTCKAAPHKRRRSMINNNPVIPRAVAIISQK